MKKIYITFLLLDALFAQGFSKLGFVYITVLRLADQFVHHNEIWRPLAIAVNYLVKITPIVYMASQTQPAFPVGVQLNSGMGGDKRVKIFEDIP
ncbi:hypothetical protein DSO57_1037665, partial [Entomophthora muscae]